MRVWMVSGFLAILTSLLTGQVVSATNGWLSSNLTVKSSVNVGGLPSSVCKTTMVNYEVDGEPNPLPVCLNQTGPLKFGYYIKDYNPKFVVSYGSTNKLLPLEGLDCDVTCIYSPQTDSLISRRNISSAYVKSMVVINKFSSRLSLDMDFSRSAIIYRLTDNQPSYIFQSADGYAYPVNGIGLSSNGRYLGIEARQRGVLVLDLKTMKMKRISNYAYSYGYGMDPGVEIAVSSDGDNLVAMGSNAGIKFWGGLLSCGDEPTDDRMMNVSKLDDANVCSEVAVNSDDFISRFAWAVSPRFTASGSGLRFFAVSYNDEYEDVYLSNPSQSKQTVSLLGIGDSFSSGEGETSDDMYQPYTNTSLEKCHTSKRSYPYLVGNLSGYSYATYSVACSGATTKDILGINQTGAYWGQGDRLESIVSSSGEGEALRMQRDSLLDFIPGRIGQIDFASEYQPDVITIGIGGNDVDLVGKLKACIEETTCDYAEAGDQRLKVAVQILSLQAELERTYQRISDSSPNSRIYAVGYPQIISRDGKCDLISGFVFDDTERLFMREAIVLINQVIRVAASNAGIKYVDIENVYGDSTLCGTSQDIAMNGITQGDDFGLTPIDKSLGNESFHPRPHGHSLVASAILALHPNIMTGYYCSGKEARCPTPTSSPELSPYWTSGADLSLLNLTVRQSSSSVSPVTGEGRSRSIGLGPHSLQPNSSVSIAVHSQVALLGDFVVSGDGSLDAIVELPSDLEYGFHTITFRGLSYEGGPIEYQQIIYLKEPYTETLTAGPADSQVGANTTNSQPVANTAPTQEYRYIVDEPAVLGAFTEKPGDLAQDSEPKNQTAPASQSFWLAYIGVCAVGLGILGGVLYIRRVRNTIKI